MDAGMEQRFGGIDIPQSGNLGLFHEKDLDGQAGFCGQLAQQHRCEVARERLDAKMVERFRKLVGIVQMEMPEHTRVIEDQGAVVNEPEPGSWWCAA
jgi:hypothetical protein